jgi:hypothetical protein
MFNACGGVYSKSAPLEFEGQAVTWTRGKGGIAAVTAPGQPVLLYYRHGDTAWPAIIVLVVYPFTQRELTFQVECVHFLMAFFTFEAVLVVIPGSSAFVWLRRDGNPEHVLSWQ